MTRYGAYEPSLCAIRGGDVGESWDEGWINTLR